MAEQWPEYLVIYPLIWLAALSYIYIYIYTICTLYSGEGHIVKRITLLM